MADSDRDPRVEDPGQETGWKQEGVELCLSEAWEGKSHAYKGRPSDRMGCSLVTLSCLGVCLGRSHSSSPAPLPLLLSLPSFRSCPANLALPRSLGRSDYLEQGRRKGLDQGRSVASAHESTRSGEMATSPFTQVALVAEAPSELEPPGRH